MNLLTRRWLIGALAALILVMGALSPAHAAAPPNPVPQTERPPHVLQAGEVARCLVSRAGLDRATFADANRLLNPDLLRAGQAVQLPALGPERLYTLREGETPLIVALREHLPLWEIELRNPPPFYAGRDIALPGAAVDEPCLPYPLTAVELAPQPLVRGRTALLLLETRAAATCEVRYLGQAEPCYRLDENHLAALVAVSALTDPGTYPLDVRLFSHGVASELGMGLEIAPGRYGFQFIDPPPTLTALMDATLMQRELDYLAPWRGVRTAERMWELPLAFPLSVAVPISADYGDRRSYGGLVDGYHSGIDFRAWGGLPVLAPADGVVMMAEPLSARGNVVLIDHGWGLVTGYWHLSRIDVQVGQKVHRGDAIALVGNTGLSTGAHLHWEMWVNGVSVDAKQWLDPQELAGLMTPAGDHAAGSQPTAGQ